jgi:hypothetical protein
MPPHSRRPRRYRDPRAPIEVYLCWGSSTASTVTEDNVRFIAAQFAIGDS